MANNIRDWTVGLSYIVDKASQAAFLQSAKQTTQALNQEAAKQAAVTKNSEAQRMAGAMRVNAFLAGASKQQIAQITATHPAIQQAVQRQTQIVTAAAQQQSRAVVTGAQSQANAQIAHAVRSGQALSLYRAAQVQGYAQMAHNVGASMRTFGQHVTAATTAAGTVVRNLGSTINTTMSLTRPLFMAVGAAAIGVGGNIGYLTNSLDKLHNLAKKTGSSSADIRALRQSISMMGGSEDEADAMITGLSNAMLANRGVGGFLKGLGISDMQSSAEILEQFSDVIRQMPSDVAQQYGNIAGLSPDAIRYLQSGKFKEQMAANRAELAKWGVDEERATRAGKSLADEWRRFKLGFGAIDRLVSTSLIEGGGGLWGRLNKWMLDNAKAITTAAKTFTGVFSDQLLKWGDKFLKIFENPESFEKFKKEWSDWWEGIKNYAIAVKDAIVSIAEYVAIIAKVIGGLRGGVIGTVFNKEGKVDAGHALRKLFGIGDEKGESPGTDWQSVGPKPGNLLDDARSIGSWLKNLFGISADANTDASKNFKESVDKFDKTVDKLTGGPGGAGGGAGSGGFWNAVKGAWEGRSTALGGTGEGVGAGFKRGMAGGAGGAGGGGSFMDKLAEIESGNRNIFSGVDPDVAGPGTRSQGYFQITTPTWRDFAGKAGVDLNQYPNAMSAPRDVQARVASVIPFKRFGPRTQQMMRQQFGDLDRNETVGELAKRFGGEGAAGGEADAEGKKALIIHHTGGRGSAEGVVSTLNQRGLGVQYIIDREGNLVETGMKSAHMRPGQGIGKGLSNANTYGVEVIAKDDKDILPAQVAAAKALAERLGMSGSVYGHGEVNPHKQETEGSTIVDAIRADQARKATIQAAEQARKASASTLDRIRSTAATVGKGVSDIIVPKVVKTAGGIKPDYFNPEKSFGDFGEPKKDPGRYIGPSQTTDNSKKIDFDAIYNTSINTSDPKQAATSFQRAHEQLNSMSQRQLQGMYR